MKKAAIAACVVFIAALQMWRAQATAQPYKLEFSAKVLQCGLQEDGGIVGPQPQLCACYIELAKYGYGVRWIGFSDAGGADAGTQ